jgi:hypothetical protein
VTLWACPFKGVRPFSPISQKWTGPSKRCAPFQKGRALPKGARPTKRGAPFLTHWSKLNMPFQKGRALSKGAPFPLCQTVSQELRMDGGIAKSGPACRNWARTHTLSVSPGLCLSSSELRYWRGCVVVDRSSQVQVLSAHLLLQQQVLGARPPPEERTSRSYLSFPFYILMIIFQNMLL